MINLKKRTKEQVKHSIEVDKDFTGGYDNFWAWLIWMNMVFTFVLLPLAIFMIIMSIVWVAPFITIALPLIVMLWMLLLLNDYRLLKNGQSQ